MAWMPGTHLKVPPLKSLLPGSWPCCHQALAGSEDPAVLHKQVSREGHGSHCHGYIRHCNAKHVNGNRSAVRSSCCWEPDSPVIRTFRVSSWAGCSAVLRAGARVRPRMGRALLQRVFQLRAARPGISAGALIPFREGIKARQARRFAERPCSQSILIHKYSMHMIGAV